MENYTIIAYLIYLPIAILLTVWVSRQLFKNSQVCMLDIFRGRKEIALSTNRLFEMGFYLLNIGFAFLIMQEYGIESLQALFEKLSIKIGGFSIYLGIMLFFNLFLFFRGKRKANQRAALEGKIDVQA